MQNQWDNQGRPSGDRPNGQRETKPPAGYWKRMWRIWEGFVIKLAVDMGVSNAAATACMLLYHYQDIMGLQKNPDGFFALNQRLMEELARYSTQIAGASAVIAIPIMWALFHKDRKRERKYGAAQNKKAPLRKYGAVIVLFAAVCVGLNNLIIIGNLSAFDSAYKETAEAFYKADFASQLLFLGILIPIAEELVFRGLMFKRLREQVKFLQSALYSSLAFGIFHGNITQMLYAFLLGMLLSYVYEKYGSVKAPIAAHITANTASVFATEYGWFGWLMKDIFRIGAATVLCAAVSAAMLVLIQRIDERPEFSQKPKEKGNAAAV